MTTQTPGLAKRFLQTVSGASIEGHTGSVEVNRILSQSDAGIRRQEMEDLKGIVRMRQRPGYAEAQAKIRDLYLGDQHKHARDAISARFPTTGGELPVSTYNVLRAHADLSAQVYKQEPTRRAVVEGWEVHLDDGDGYEVRDGEKRPASALGRRVQSRVRSLEKRARLRLVMAEAERRCNAAGIVFGRITPEEPEHGSRRELRYHISLHWACDVWAVEDESAPGDMQRAHALIVRLDGGREEAWTRGDIPLGDDGSTVPGWWVTTFDLDGTFIKRTTYAGNLLPWFAMHSMYSDVIYSHERSGVVDTQDAVNVAVSSWLLKDDLQGYSQLYTTGPEQRKGETMIGGPRTIMTFPRDTTVGKIDTQHDMTTLQGMEKMLETLALVSRMPRGSLSTTQGATLSGWSRVLESMPALERRAENIELYRLVEEEQIWPVLTEQHDMYEPDDVRALGHEVAVAVEYPPPPDYEDPAAKLSRAVVAYNAGFITRRRAAVDGGLYASMAAAAAAGVPDTFITTGEAIDMPEGTDNNLRGASDIGVRDGAVSIAAEPTEEPDE